MGIAAKTPHVEQGCTASVADTSLIVSLHRARRRLCEAGHAAPASGEDAVEKFFLPAQAIAQVILALPATCPADVAAKVLADTTDDALSPSPDLIAQLHCMLDERPAAPALDVLDGLDDETLLCAVTAIRASRGIADPSQRLEAVLDDLRRAATTKRVLG